MDFHGMKRQALQSLCKKHGIPANLTNHEMADRLALLLKENEKPVDNSQPTSSNNLGETHCEIESNFKIVNQKVSKKVRFSPENETFIFVSSDTESDSDHGNNPKRRLRKRKSVSNLESKKQVQLRKNVKKAEVSAEPLDNSGRVTRSRVQRVVAGDAEMVFSPLAGNKRGRRRVKNVGVNDKPPPIADLGDKDDPREDAKWRGGLIRQRLRSKEVVNEAGEKAGDGDLAVLRKNSRLRGSKNIRNVKASDGVVLLDQIHEDNAIAVEEAKPEQILKRSKRITAKNKGSSSLSKDLGDTGIGRRVTRSRKLDEKDSSLESEAGSIVVEEESQKVLQLEEPAKGSRRKSVAPQNGKVQSESLATKRTERGQPVKGSRKRSRKIDSEGVPKVEPIVGVVTKDEDLLPDGPPWRSRHSIASFNSVATAVGELRTQDNDGKKKPQREAPLESDVNIAKQPRRSSRHASKEVGGIADGVRKDLQTRQSKKQILKEESSVTVHEPVTKKALRRSRPNVSKSNVPELADPKGRSAEKNKPSKARMEIIEEEGSFRKSSLSRGEQPVMDIVPECGGSKNDSDLYHRKKVRERSNKKRKEGKSVEHSQLGSAEISALNSDEKEFTYDTLKSEEQVSESMEVEGASIFQQMQDSTAEVVDNEKENIVEEARMENLSLDSKLEGSMEYQSHRSFNTRAESGDGKLVEQVSTEPVEHLSKINNVVSCGIISPASGFSPAYPEDSNGLKAEESLMEKHVNPVSDKVDDLLADNGKANAQEDKIILELDTNGNYEPVQEETIQENHLSELTGSRDSERSSEKFSNEAENIYVLVPYDRNEAEEAVQENHLSELSGSRESERSSEKFSNEAEKICVLVPYERHGIAQVDEYATETADIVVEKVADIQLGIIASDDTAAAPSEPPPQSQDGNQLEALTAMHLEIVGRSDAYHVERENCSNNLIEVPDETISSEDISFSKLRGQVCSNERTEEIGTMKEKESSEYGEERTPNEIAATVSHIGEFNFRSSEKRGEVLPERSESCLSCGGNTANKEENVGKAVDDPKPQVISFDAETKDNVDGVNEDDVNDHLVEKELQTMYPFTSMHEEGTNEAVEINSCSPAAVEETEAETIDKCGLEGMSKNEEDKEEHVVTNKVTEMEEAENGAPMLPLYSMGDDTAFSKYEIELSKTNDLAQGASDVTMSSEYEDGGTPNEIVATVSQVGEFNFTSSERQGDVLPDLDKSASIYAKSCLSCDGKTANKEENVGNAVDDPKAQVISSHAEIKEYVDRVTEDDVDDLLVEKELETMYPFTSMHEVVTKEAVEINSCSLASVDEMEAQRIGKFSPEEMSKNGEDKEELAITNKVTEMEVAENGAPMLPLDSVGDDTAFSKYEIELLKTNGLAQCASDVTMSSEYEDGRTPNEIVATVSQVGEFHFTSSERQGDVLPDMDKSASIYAKSCPSCDGKTANKEENVRKAVSDPKAQVISFDAETKDNVHGVIEDDVNDHLVEKELQTMYPFTSMHKVGTKEAAEIHSCSPAVVEEMEAESIDNCDHEEMSKNGEDREEHAVTNKVTVKEEAENGTPTLPLDSMWDDTALSKFEIELSKTNRLALGASDVTMSSKYEDGGTPNEIVATVSQVGEFNFTSSERQGDVLPDLDKSASIYAKSCLSCDGKTANKEENVGNAVNDQKAQVISSHAEIKEYVDRVTEDDVDDHLVEKELETMYPFTSMHEVVTKEAVEINSCSLASVDEMEAQRIGKFGPEEMSKNGEDKEELVMTDKMEEAESGTPMLPLDSMVHDTAFSKYETELSKTNGLALGSSDVTMSSEYEDGGTPNKIVATVSQVGEFNFGSSEKQGEVLPDMDKSASIYSESCLFCDGKTANKEENVGKAVVDPKAQVISSDAETKENVDGVTEDDVTDHLVEKVLLEQNDNGPDLTLRNAHESCIYATDEGDDILDRRIGIENVEDGTKLDEQLISPFGLNNGCLSDEKKSAVKSFSVAPSGRNVPGSSTATFSVQNFSLSCVLSAGKEYEFHAYSNRVRNYAEGIEMANEDKGFGHEKMNPPAQGENELGIDKRVEGQNSNEGINDSTHGFAVENNARTSPQVVAEKLDGYTDVLKLANQMDSDDDLDLNNLFNSNSTNSKRNSKETGKEIDLHDLDNVAISSGQSNEFSDCGNNASILKPEMNVECSAVSPATASTTEIKALEIAAEMTLFTSYELNLFSEDRERDEFEEADVRTLEDKLINKNNEEVNEGREIVSSIENFEKEQHCDYEQSMVEDKPNLINETNEVSEGREIVGSMASNLELNEGRENVESIGKDCDDEHGMVEEFEIGKQNQLSASDESIYENRSIPKEKGGVPVIKQGLVDCEIHKFECIEFENYTEATQINASNYAASDTSKAECCASDSKKPEIHVNSAVEAVALENPQKLESREDKSPEAKLMERISRSAMPKMKTNKDFSIPRTPKNIHKIYDMKENFPSSKREQVNNMTATKTSVKRRALEDLQKN
ncbi:uncharacterized protein LOC107405986 isoform X1 [Ziziphus jujuba]|uniref:Uncharacterized protein LOC107405986 isoform X1 n=1 Tax=Ziziphus jujuba TaxID=326968 RepID=A0A6P6FT95_ZIZJJ|nr:uncharacterized protein LOC107405986 isoform X1 [Ziziphus jujuba]